MTRVFITGDTHSTKDWKKINTTNFPVQKSLTKDDFLIIAGDFGGVWDNSPEDKYVIDSYNARNFTTLFVDGNHENHVLLDSYPVTEFCGGKVHKIRDSVYHLMRGQVYEIGGKTFFAFGGARSHDKYARTEGIDWWPEELPSEEEMAEGLRNLERYDFKVNYVVTHCCPKYALMDLMLPGLYEEDILNKYFDDLMYRYNLDFEKWFFGHYHGDRRFEKWQLLYNQIVELPM